MEKMEGMAQALVARGSAENNVADQSSAFTAEESADETLAPVREVLSAREEGGDAVRSVAQEDVEMKTAPSATGLTDDGNEKMEEAVTSTVEVESYAQKASQAVWKVIEPLVPNGTKYAELNIDDRILLDLHGNVNQLPLSTKVTDIIVDAYKDVDELTRYRIVVAHLPAITASVKEALNQPTKADMERLKQLAAAFAGSYSGSAHDEFTTYLTRCCAQYRANPTVYIAPWVAITQSSGFERDGSEDCFKTVLGVRLRMWTLGDGADGVAGGV
ncbi:unnamed protein product [Phytophthora fragariaefolia]|uniref:Unnamed protein product n=1 Tax=Phytophthora fragariaefolia TaxID=1490495 RepID=A0A9W7DBU9_9STRA|nr:unnamed protein product [Phytophthora fragariaefolia]